MSLTLPEPVLLPRKRRRSRRGRVLPLPGHSARLYVYIAPSKVHLFRCLLEAADNLALISVADRWRAALLIRFSSHQADELRAVLADIQEGVDCTVVEVPGRRPE